VSDTYWIELKYASGGIIVGGDVVIKAPPIFRHLEGRLLPNVEHWVRSCHGKIEKLQNSHQDSSAGPHGGSGL
jgi:hypothetical protein